MANTYIVQLLKRNTKAFCWKDYKITQSVLEKLNEENGKSQMFFSIVINSKPFEVQTKHK